MSSGKPHYTSYFGNTLNNREINNGSNWSNNSKHNYQLGYTDQTSSIIYTSSSTMTHSYFGNNSNIIRSCVG